MSLERVRWLFAPVSARRLAIVRITVGGYALCWLAFTSVELVGLGRLDAARFDPVGVVGVAGVGPHSTATLAVIVAVTAVAGCGFTAGWRYPIAGPVFAAGILWLTTYQNSWSKLLHTENLMVIHVAVLAVAPVAGSLVVGRAAPDAGSDARGGWPLRAMAAATVLSYLTAGVTKLRHAGIAWFDPENLRNWLAYDLVRKELFGDPYLHVLTPLLRHPWVLLPAVVFTGLIEFGAPIALIGRRFAVVWMIGAWGFHLGVLATMSVVFPYQLIGIAYLPLLLLAIPRRTLTARHATTTSGDEPQTPPRSVRPMLETAVIRPVEPGWRIWQIAAMWSAWFSCRFPRVETRCTVRPADENSTGAVPL